MCGILGGNIKNWNYEKGILSLKHRGPDSKHIIEYNECILAFARLSIMDLSENAMQPMVNDAKNVSIVYNGEIYGFDKLKSDLSKKYLFKTTSDTEVILYAYMEYGDDFIEYIDGMFSIAIYDQRFEQIKLYRDRYGIKPLYYYIENEQFAFSSELKALIAANDNLISFKIDNTAIYDYLIYQYIPEPKSLYQKIYKLEPASFLHYDLKKKKIIRKGQYWNINVNCKKHGKIDKNEVIYNIKQLIRESVKKQMIADVPVGTFLSGGIDSSIISLESKFINPQINSFSIGFKEKESDESIYAQMLAQKFNIINQLTMLSFEDIEKIKGKLHAIYDEPFADTSAYPTYLLSKKARENVVVALTGDGGDELFGGYERYKIVYDKYSNCKMGKEELLDKYSRWVGIFNTIEQEKWKKHLNIDKDYDARWHLRKHYSDEMPIMTSMRYLDFKTYLPGAIFTKVDRASMNVSLETRVPFLERNLVEYVFSLAEDEVYYDNELKAILKKAYEKEIPMEILYRKKKGFSIPSNYVAENNETKYMAILRQEWPYLASEYNL